MDGLQTTRYRGNVNSRITYEEKLQSNVPLVTIITVTFNNAAKLEKTLRSVLDQTYPNIEYIVIDGGSNDETLAILNGFHDAIDYWLSEPDDGPYDAMNKGIKLAHGTYINFMNAGDSFYDNKVVQTIFETGPKADLLFGDHILETEHGRRYIKAKAPVDLWRGMIFSHQSLFTRAEVFRSFGFSMRIAADYEFVLRCFGENRPYRYFPVPVCIYLLGGVSDQFELRSTVDRLLINLEQHSKPKLQLAAIYCWFVARYLLGRISLLRSIMRWILK